MNRIDEYITGFPEETQKLLEQLRKTIRKAAPEAEETINYGIPTLTLKGNLVHFAALKITLDFILRHQELKHLKKNFLSIRMQKVLFSSRLTSRFLLT